MKLTNVLTSCLDDSVNFVYDNAMEARYVQRVPEYFIVYLSSHDGCNKACRFCHLTQTKQTKFNPASIADYLTQVDDVLRHYDDKIVAGMSRASHVNFNFMARGEPLANELLVAELDVLDREISGRTRIRGLTYSLNLSSIVPEGSDLSAIKAAMKSCSPNVALYYSLYSVNPDFRKRWLPKAMPPLDVLTWIASSQAEFNLPVTLHWAIIEGQNDDPDDIKKLCEMVEAAGVSAKFNLVRYNPYSEDQGKEASEEVLTTVFETMKEYMSAKGSRIVPKVGFDVKASCGMFVKNY